MGAIVVWVAAAPSWGQTPGAAASAPATAGDAVPQDASPTAEQMAAEAFARGTGLFEQENYAAAAVQFRIAYKNRPSWKLLFNIGQSEAGAKRYGLALEAFEKYLVDGGDQIPEERMEYVTSEIRRLRTLVGLLDIEGPEGFDVFVDGVKRGTLPLTGHVPVAVAVEHTIRGVRGDVKTFVQTVKVISGQVLPVALQVDPDTEESAAAQAGTGDAQSGADDGQSGAGEMAVTADVSASTVDVSAPDRRWKIAAIVTAGVGVGLLAAGTVTGVAALRKNAAIEEQCLPGFEDADVSCVLYASQRDAVRTRNRLATVTTPLLVAGGVAAATGVVLWIIGVKRHKATAVSAGVFGWEVAF